MKNRFKLEAWAMILFSVIAVLVAFLSAVMISYIHRG
jgi:MFS-type transporter involved in bile tolerance (Atg22 family)